MAPEELTAAIRRPFVPFRLNLTEGSTYDVNHPEFCIVGRRSVIVGLAPLGDEEHLFDHSVTMDLFHIVKLEPLDAPTPPKSNGSQK